MASGLIFDPLKLLRLAPLITTTTTLTYAGNEFFYLSNFLAPEHGDKSSDILPTYFKRMFNTGIWIVIGMNSLTITSSVVNLVTLPPSPGSLFSRLVPRSTPSGRWLYGAGLFFTVMHFAFVPFVAYPVRDIIEDRSRSQSTRDLRKWLDVHRTRVLTADLPGWLCFLAGVLAMVSV